jgi:DUF1365 family protein
LQAQKVFHVSPFCTVEGSYRFRFFRNDLGLPNVRPRTVARVDHHDTQGLLLSTSVSGALTPLTASGLRQGFWRMPLLTLGITARIHWQALQLWCRRVPFFRKPKPPSTLVSSGSTAA